MTGGHVTVLDPAPTGHPLVDAVLRRIEQDPQPRDARDWIVRLTRDVRAAVLDRLVSTGQLRREPRKILPDRYPTPDGRESPVVGRARQRMRAAVTGSGPVDPPAAALGGLVDALGWTGRCLPELSRQQRDRLAEFRRADRVATVVKDLADERRAGPWGPAAARIMTNLDEYR